MISRRDVLKTAAAGAATSGLPPTATFAAGEPAVQPGDRILLSNEDSNTLTVIDPTRNEVLTTVNFTSFDEDARPPFRFVTGGVMPTHVAMVTKPLYHGAIHLHGGAPSPDQRLSAFTGRGSSNVYLLDNATLRLVGNRPNPSGSEKTNSERITSGILVGREPHEPTFSRNGKELWVAVRGENRIVVLDVEQAHRESAGEDVRSVRLSVPTLDGPAQIWFSKDGALGSVISQKVATIEVIETQVGSDGFSRPRKSKTIDIGAQDPFGFTPFQKVTPDGAEMWFSHKLADAVSARAVERGFDLVDHVKLPQNARPNHVEFVENATAKVVYVSFARVDDGGPAGVAASQIGIIDRSAPAGQRRVVGSFFSMGREAHGIWTNPDHTRLYVAHEQDELPGTPNAGQTVCTVFDVSDPLGPRFVKQIPLGQLDLPSGALRNKKSINLVYVRPGAPAHSG